MFILFYLFNERKLTYYLCLYLIYSLKLATIFTYPLTDCNLIPIYMNEYNTSVVEYLPNIKCEKSTPCGMIDASSSRKSQKSLNIALEKLNIVKKDNVSSLVQPILSASLSTQQETEGSFLVKIYLGANDTCYNFHIPFSSFPSVKTSFALPVISLHLLSQSSQRIFVGAYYRELKESKYEIISLQVAMYILEGLTTVQDLHSGFMDIKPVFDKRNIYLTSDEEVTCLSLYNISIIESFGHDLCNPLTQHTLCQWVSELESSKLDLKCSTNNLEPGQTYCIHSYFFARVECKYIFPLETVQMTFFKTPDCQSWNASVYVATSGEKIEIQFFPWSAYDNCFLYYEFRLYPKLKSHDCGAGAKSPNQKIIVNHTQQSVTLSFADVPVGNYCFLIIPCDIDEICYRKLSLKINNVITIKDQVSTSVSPLPIEDNGSQKYPLQVVIAGFLLLLITVPVLLWCLVRKCRHVKDFDDYEIRQEGFPMVLPRTLVDFFYSFDENTLNKVHGFVNSLRACPDIEVKTIEEEFHEIFPNPEAWFEDKIRWECCGRCLTCSSNRRLIIVVSDRALELIDQPAETLQGSNEEDFFRYVLNYMLNHYETFHDDHFHVIKVCFDARFDNEQETRKTCHQILRDKLGSWYNVISRLLHWKRTSCVNEQEIGTYHQVLRNLSSGPCFNLTSRKRMQDFISILRKTHTSITVR